MMTEVDPLEKFGGRKFVLCIFTVFCATLMVLFGKMDSASFMTLLGIVAPVYIAGNVVQKKFENADMNKSMELDNRATELEIQKKAIELPKKK